MTSFSEPFRFGSFFSRVYNNPNQNPDAIADSKCSIGEGIFQVQTPPWDLMWLHKWVATNDPNHCGATLK